LVFVGIAVAFPVKKEDKPKPKPTATPNPCASIECHRLGGNFAYKNPGESQKKGDKPKPKPSSGSLIAVPAPVQGYPIKYKQ